MIGLSLSHHCFSFPPRTWRLYLTFSVERVGGVDMKALAAGGVDIDAMLRYYIFQTEFLWKVLDPREDEGKLVTVFDVAGVG
jgi:hypothetical protein